MFNLSAKRHYLINSFTGYENEYSIIVRDIQVNENTLILDLKVNHTDDTISRYNMIEATVTYNLLNDTYTTKATGKGSRKHSYNIKRTVTIVIDHLVKQATDTYKGDTSEARSLTVDYYCYQLQEAGATTAQSNQMYYDINQTYNTVQEAQEAFNTLMNELTINEEVAPTIEVSEDETVSNKIMENETTYIAYNRAFASYEAAEQYCNESDFDPIITEEVLSSSHRLDLQFFSNTDTNEPVHDATISLTYTIETKDWNKDDSYPTFYKGDSLIIAMMHFKEQHLKGEDVVLFITDQEGNELDTITNYSGVSNIINSKELFVPTDKQLKKEHKEAINQMKIYNELYQEELIKNDTLKKDNERLYIQLRKQQQEINKLNKMVSTNTNDTDKTQATA